MPRGALVKVHEEGCPGLPGKGLEGEAFSCHLHARRFASGNTLTAALMPAPQRTHTDAVPLQSPQKAFTFSFLPTSNETMSAVDLLFL